MDSVLTRTIPKIHTRDIRRASARHSGEHRRTCYNRVANRIVKEQAGWVSGMGAFDPGLALGLIIQQARRMKQPLYLLFIDLKSFFSTIHREALHTAELWHGVPKEVADLTDEMKVLYPEFELDPPLDLDVGGHTATSAPSPLSRPFAACMSSFLSVLFLCPSLSLPDRHTVGG